PFASLHKLALSGEEQSVWERNYQDGTAAQAAGDYRGALKAFSEAAAVDSGFAELHFRCGVCDLALTNLVEAKRDKRSANGAKPCASKACTLRTSGAASSASTW